MHDEGLRRRYSLKRMAECLLNDKEQRIGPDGQACVHFTHRVAMCCRGMEGPDVEIKTSPDGQRAEYRGVQTCASSWHCPLCGPKIAAKHVEQMNLAIHRWLSGELAPDGRVYLVTYTMQHNREHAGQGECKPAVSALCDALGAFKGNRPYKSAMARAGYVGAIRALEVQYGELNGWHPHAHEIIFAGPGLLARDNRGRVIRWQSPLFKLARPWARELLKRGLGGLKPGDAGAVKFKKLRHLLRHCLDARDGAYAAEYVAKYFKEPEGERGRWGLASELAKSHLKGLPASDGSVRRCAHASPGELLNDCLDGDMRSGELWREYALALRGRAKLYWSPGLKRLLNIPDISEIEIARAADARCTVPCIRLAPIQWRIVIAHDARFDVLRAAATEGAAGVLALLDTLSHGPPSPLSDEFTRTDLYDGYRPGYALYKTPDGRTHKFWELPK